MSCLKRCVWEVVPENLPMIERHCPKCNQKTNYINSEKFRVNANKNSIDVWLIYQCEKCKSTWNMCIYERINTSDINKEEYKKFLSNDENLARDYGFDVEIHNKNKINLMLDKVCFKVIKEEEYEGGEMEIEIHSKYSLDLRVDKFLSDNFNVSRSRIKNMIKEKMIYSNDDKKLEKAKVRDGMHIYVFVK